MATPNENPSNNSIARKVSFKTINTDNGDIIIEPHTVSGPTPAGTFNIPLNGASIGTNKYVVPLQTTTGLGSYWLKFWLPQPDSDIMYVTFCIKNNSMADGFYDYNTGIPSEYRTALRTWIKDNRLTTKKGAETFKKNLLFTVYGLDTNKISSAIQYQISFTAIFGEFATSILPKQPK